MQYISHITDSENILQWQFTKITCYKSRSNQINKKKTDAIKTVGFRLTEFISNDTDVMNSMWKEKRTDLLQSPSIFNDKINEQTILVKWDVTKKVFTTDTVKTKKKDFTKKNKLKTVVSFFHPAGFVASFVLTRKIFLQELWRLTIHWVDMITEWQCKLDESGKGS